MKYFSLIICALLVGCAGGLTQADRELLKQSRANAKRVEELEVENRRQRKVIAGQQKNGSSEPQPLIQVNTTTDDDPGPSKHVVTTGKSWVSKEHGEYHCYVGRKPHRAQGDTVTFTNGIHNNYGLKTVTNTKANKYVGIKLNGSRVVMMRGGYRSNYLLGPGEFCTAMLGGEDDYIVTSELFKNQRGSKKLAVPEPTGIVRYREFSISAMQDEYAILYDNQTFR